LVDRLADGLQVDAALATEIVKQQTVRDLRGFGDVTGRHVVVAVLGEKVNRGGDKALPGLGGLCRAACVSALSGCARHRRPSCNVLAC
jgi:hypothetical protein